MQRIHFASKERIDKGKKRWIRENTRIGPVLEVTVCYHRGGYGIEIRYESLSRDRTHSWLRISAGMNKYVMEKSEILPSPRTTGKLVPDKIERDRSLQYSSSI